MVVHGANRRAGKTPFCSVRFRAVSGGEGSLHGETRNWKLETRNSKFEIRVLSVVRWPPFSLRPREAPDRLPSLFPIADSPCRGETRNWKLETRNSKIETRQDGPLTPSLSHQPEPRTFADLTFGGTTSGVRGLHFCLLPFRLPRTKRAGTSPAPTGLPVGRLPAPFLQSRSATGSRFAFAFAAVHPSWRVTGIRSY